MNSNYASESSRFERDVRERLAREVRDTLAKSSAKGATTTDRVSLSKAVRGDKLLNDWRPSSR